MSITSDHSQCIFRMFCLSYNIHDIELSLLSLTWEEMVKENREVFYARENSALQSVPTHRPLPKARHATQERTEMILSQHHCPHTALMGDSKGQEISTFVLRLYQMLRGDKGKLAALRKAGARGRWASSAATRWALPPSPAPLNPSTHLQMKPFAFVKHLHLEHGIYLERYTRFQFKTSSQNHKFIKNNCFVSGIRHKRQARQ